VAHDRVSGKEPAAIARAFQRGVAGGVCAAVNMLCESQGARTAVLSGGVFQNEMLLHDVKAILEPEAIRIWTNASVPPNDGGISLGQAALAVFGAVQHA
jgi:hydrogenase maturation protein HypF